MHKILGLTLVVVSSWSCGNAQKCQAFNEGDPRITTPLELGLGYEASFSIGFGEGPLEVMGQLPPGMTLETRNG